MMYPTKRGVQTLRRYNRYFIFQFMCNYSCYFCYQGYILLIKYNQP